MTMPVTIGITRPFVEGHSSRMAEEFPPRGRRTRQAGGATRTLAAKQRMPPANQGLVYRSAARSFVLGSLAARGSRLLRRLLREDRLDGVSLGSRLAFNLRPDRLGAFEDVGIGLA